MSLLVHLLRLPILAYRYTLSGLIGHACRYQPTCSQYALDALAVHGAGRGLWLTLRRLARCHPWGGSGWDPVPQPGRPDRPIHHPRALRNGAGTHEEVV